MDVIVYRSNEQGELTAGWHRVRSDLMAAAVDEMIDEGLEARASMPAGDPKRREIGAWIDTLQTKGFVSPGNYRLAGKAVVHVEAATVANLVATHQRSQFLSAQAQRAARYGSATLTRKSTPQSLSAVIAKARKVLAA